MKERFVVVTEHEGQVRWLETAVGPDAEAVVVDDPTPERVAQLTDAASGSLVFVRFDHADLRTRVALVEGVLEKKPNLLVIGIGDSDDKQLVLAAMRAGASDYLRVGCDAAEVHDSVKRLGSRAMGSSHRSEGRQIAILCARPDIATSTFAVHLALRSVGLAQPDQKVLMIDLALPAADSLLFLDIEPSYSFIDAVRSVRRFDETLVESAFSRDRSGLAVLPLPEDPTQITQVNGNDMLTLFSVLKSYFDQTILNLGGLRSPEFLLQALAQADDALMLVDQSVASCSAARVLLEGLAEGGFPTERIGLVIDRYTPKIEPGPEKIAEVLGIRLAATLPPNGFAMIQAMNQAQTIFEVAPDSEYCAGVTAMAADLMGTDVPAARRRGLAGAAQRLRGAFARSA